MAGISFPIGKGGQPYLSNYFSSLPMSLALYTIFFFPGTLSLGFPSRKKKTLETEELHVLFALISSRSLHSLNQEERKLWRSCISGRAERIGEENYPLAAFWITWILIRMRAKESSCSRIWCSPNGRDTEIARWQDFQQGRS